MTDIVELEKKFWARVVKNDGCWSWSGSVIKRDGRGVLSHAGRNMLAPRISWLIHNGPIQNGLFVCHSCDNPNCVNPDHLWLGTAKCNARDAAAKGRLGMQLHPKSSFFNDDRSNEFRPKGEAHGNSVLDAETVMWIRSNYMPRDRFFGARAIARKLGVNKDTVYSVLRGRTWKHV